MDTLVAIFICVVLPVAIVFLCNYPQINANNKNAQILIKAIESDKDIDTDKLIEATRMVKKTPRELLNLRLLRGCIFSFIGLALCIVGIVSFHYIGALSEDSFTVPLVFGGISLAIGLSYLVVYFVTRKQIKD